MLRNESLRQLLDLQIIDPNPLYSLFLINRIQSGMTGELLRSSRHRD